MEQISRFIWQNIIGFIDMVLVPLIFSITFIVFIWGIFQYFVAGGADEEKRKQGRQLALWGIIGFAIMLSVWGLVQLLVSSLGFQNQTRPNLPTFGQPQQQAPQQQNFQPSGNAPQTGTPQPSSN